jgi:autophagy-related protein 33
LSSASFLGLTLAYALSPPRVRHPYLLWTALVAATSGSLTLAADLKVLQRRKRDANVPEINGEQVERTTRDRQLWEFLRTGLSGLGFAMAVVGIWGDGA